MVQILDGNCSEPNIFADDIGQYNISVWGSGDYVLPVGEQLAYELVSNNEITIKDGLFITQGRRGVVKKGTIETCVIENGTQAENRNDLIIMEYACDAATALESHTIKVIKGTPGTEAVDPEVITGDIQNGALLHQMPLYRVCLEGLNVVAVEQLFQYGKIALETVDPTKAESEGLAADAKLTGEHLRKLNNNLGGTSFSVGEDGNAYISYKVGADTVLKKLGSGIPENLTIVSATFDGGTLSNGSKTLIECMKGGGWWYLNNANDTTVNIEFSEPVAFRGVYLDGEYHTSLYRGVDTLRMYGSNDKEEYTLLINKTVGFYDNPTAYKYYKLELSFERAWIGLGYLCFFPYVFA